MSATQLMDTRPDDSSTKVDLIETAVKHFGDHGFDAASLRAIVAEAGQNISSIKYHFGSKQGLYDACARAVAHRKKVEGPGVVLRKFRDPLHQLTMGEAKAAIRHILMWVFEDALQSAPVDHTKFLRREILMGGRGTDLFLAEVMTDHIDVMATLVATAEDLPRGSPAARLRALGLIGQTVFFLTADTLTRKAMGWTEFEGHIDALVDAIYPQHNPWGELA